MIFIGIYMGSYAVKAVALKKTNKTFYVFRTHYFEIKADANEEQKNLLKIGHLQTLTDLYKNQEIKYIFCLPQNAISTEILTFPFKEKYKIMKSLPYEMEEKLSLFDYTKMISDIKIIDSENNKKNILVFSCFKKNISDLLTEIKSIGIKPFIITCEAAAVSNLFETTAEFQPTQKTTAETQKNITNKKQDCQIYLKIGHEYTTTMIFSQGRLQNVYSFEWGTISCIKKIALKYEIPFTKAMQQFHKKGFVLTQTQGHSGSQIEFSKIIQKEFEHLIYKLRFLLLQIEGENIYKCKKIYICGGGAQVRNLQALLTLHLNIIVTRVENLPHVPDWNLRDNDKKQNNLITALGAAMEGLKKPKTPPINFLKEEFSVKFNPFIRWKKPLLISISTLILFSAYATIRNQQSQKLSQRINTIFRKQSTQILKIRSKYINIQKVKHFIKSKKKLTQTAELNKMLSQIPSALDKIKDLSVRIKKKLAWNLKIQQLTINKNQITIKGNISSLYLKDLEKNLTNMTNKKGLSNLSPSHRIDSTMDPASSKLELSEHTQNDTVLFHYSFIQKKD